MTDITLLDGGMGQELVHRAGDNSTPLWSTQVMMDHPGLVAEVHRDYFDAGATIATTNTYAIHRDRLTTAGIGDAFESLQAVALKEVLDAKRVGTLIAGSIGPLIASYRPDIHPDEATATPLYAEVATLLVPAVDLLICETVASVSQAKSALAGAKAAGKPVWMAFTVDDEDGTKLRSGEPLADALAVCGSAQALLVNCSSPEALDAAMPILAQTGLPFGGYANAFTVITKAFLKDSPTVDSLQERRDMGPDAYAAHVMHWVAQGATIVGGCCEVGPSHIKAISTALRAAGHRIV
jgi:S-methylmethionine-dependent homocysteine/selenocysteine methylase